MGENPSLTDIDKAIKSMTPAEVGKFRKELKVRLPVMIDQAAKAAKSTKPPDPPKAAANGS